MSDKIRISYADNFRETILLMTVFYVMSPMYEIKTTAIDITWLVIEFGVFGGLLFQTARLVAKDRILFPWDKVIFFITLLMEGGFMAARAFTELPDVLSWIALVWACVVMGLGFALFGVYSTLENKGKWKYPVLAEEAGGMAFSNYLTMAVSLLAIMKGVF